MRLLIDDCLQPEPGRRPNPQQVIERISAALKQMHGFEVKPLLDCWTTESRNTLGIGRPLHQEWAAEEVAQVSNESLARTIDRITGRLDDLTEPGNLVEAAAWFLTARSLARLL